MSLSQGKAMPCLDKLDMVTYHKNCKVPVALETKYSATYICRNGVNNMETLRWLWWGKQKYDIEGKIFLSVRPRPFCRRSNFFCDRNAWFLKKMEYFVFSYKTFSTLLENYCIPLIHFAFSHRSIMFHLESLSEECITFLKESTIVLWENAKYSVYR